MSDVPPPGWGQQPAVPPPGQGQPQYPPGQGQPQYPQYPPGQGQPQYPPGQGQPQYPQYPPGQGQPQYPPGQGQPGQPQYPPGQPQYPQAPPPQGGQPGWGAQPPPGFGSQPPPGPPQGEGRSTGVVIGLVLIALVLLGGVGALVALSGGDDDATPVASDGAPTQTDETPPNETPPNETPLDETQTDQTTTTPSEARPTDGSSSTGAPVEESDQSVFELTVGTCFNDPGSADEIQSVGAVPCEGPHDNEVFALVEHPGTSTDPFPGREALTQFADEECQGQRFDDYVGAEYQFSRYFVSQFTPTESSWGQGDREIICILFDSTTQLTESVRGSGQ